MRLTGKLASLGIAAVMVIGAFPPQAAAKSAATTKMTFKLADHRVAVGDTLTGSVHLSTHAKNRWVAFAGATVTVKIDGTEVGTVVTDDAGDAVATYVVASDGDHTMKLVYAGDDTHKKSQRAQGFSASAEGDDADDEDTDDDDGDTEDDDSAG